MNIKNLFRLIICLLILSTFSKLSAQSYLSLSGSSQEISYTGAHLDLAIPTSLSGYNQLQFTLNGGDGGDRYVNYEITSYRGKGGKGATVTCAFPINYTGGLEPGGTVRFIVGEKGQGTNGIGTEGCGGGGGTGLLYLAPGLSATNEADWVILAVAGGGGGGYANGAGGKKDGKGGNDDPDGDGSNGHNSSDLSGSEHGIGGTNGEGGLASDSGEAGGAGGGGYLTNGQDILFASAGNCNGTGGTKGGILGADGGMDDSCVDGRDGGWGFGGGGSGEAAGGGGGGYSGGGGGTSGFGYSSGGGGGGSYVDDTLVDSYSMSAGGTTSDPGSGFISYYFQINGPSITSCNTLALSLNNAGNALILANQILNEYSAPIGSTTTLSQSTFGCNDIGDNYITLTITDLAGNTATCLSGVTISDQTNPTASCSNSTLTLDSNGGATLTANALGSASDACGIDQYALSQSDFDCDDIGSNTVTLTAYDPSGNSITCVGTITVTDETAPSASCSSKNINLDANGEGTLTADDVDINSSDACGIASKSLSKSSFDCDDTGINNVFLTVTDNNGNTSSCLSVVTIGDNTAPEAICNDVTIQLDASGDGTTTPGEIDDDSSDACGIQSKSLSQTSFDCSEVGTNTVTLTIMDNNSNSSDCTATVTVEDLVTPVAICQDVTVQLDDSGQASTTASAIDDGSSDACGIQSRTISQSDFDCDELGDNAVALTVADVNGNSSLCSATVTVEDNIPPVAACYDLTVDFNGEQSIGWTVDQLWNESGSTDNCVEVFAVGQSLSQATCDQLGSVLDVTVTIEDGSGNESNCNAKVTVDGLPCDWYSDPGGINCPDTETDYDPTVDEFSLTSESCYDASYYRYTDTHGFIQTELCGDGEITAQVTGVIGTGWAGISMRESNDPSARMIQLMIDGTSITRREARMSTGAPAYAHQFATQGKNWLKLSRSGNQFSAYHSLDGVNWGVVLIINIPMNNCLNIGLISMNGSSTGILQAGFENVSLLTSAGLAVPNGVEVSTNLTPKADFFLFPNPATDQFNIQLDQFVGQEAQIRIFNPVGQVVLQQDWQIIKSNVLRLNIHHLPPGTYVVEVQTNGVRKSKKLIRLER